MTPLLPTSGNPVSSTFSWTPTAADAGTYVITFTATDNSGAQAGLQTLCPISLAVSGGTGGGGSCAAPAAGSCSLGQANGYAAFIMGNVAGTKSAISEGSTKITGNVAIGSSASGSSTDLLKATIEGKLLLDPAAVVNIHPDLTVTGGIVTQSLTTARNNALAASACYAALAPTRTIRSITSSTTLTGNGGLNVINVGSIVLVKKVLTLKGGPNDIFIINVSGDFSMGSSQVVLAGGVTVNHVLWNVPGTGTTVNVYKSVTSVSGTFLVPYRDYVQDVATLYGSVLSGGNVRIHSGAKVTCPAS